MASANLPELRDKLTKHFNLGELENLCFDLGINYENLAGQTLIDKARELISYCQRHSRTDQLLQRCRELRPQIVWQIDSVAPSLQHLSPPSGQKGTTVKAYDVFVSHASEDTDFARPLAEQLLAIGFKVWFYEFEIAIGDSLRQSIDKGLAYSKYGIVILSHAFFQKEWTQYELSALFSRQINGRKVILPIWHNISRDEILAYSPLLADKFALNSQHMTVNQIAENIARVLQN